MAEADVSTLRRFNREFTKRIGVLEDRFLGRDRALGPSRVLFEIGQGLTGVADLRSRLGLDSGYLSRLLRGLESDGLVRVRPSLEDRRRRIATLTKRGEREWRELDVRSERLARRLVAPLLETQRERLDRALVTAERILRSAAASFDVVDPCSPDARWAVQQYVDELDRRFENGFDPGDATDAEASDYREPGGVFVVVHCDGAAVGCGGLRTLSPQVGEVKRMWVSQYVRGAGIGSRLLEALEAHGRRLGQRRIRLDTNGSLTEAIEMYRGNGYAEIERYNDNPYAQRWFEKRL